MLNQNSLPPIMQRILAKGGIELVYYKRFPPSENLNGSSVSESMLLPALQHTLLHEGINHLYPFQEDAFTHIMNNEDTVIAAPTGYGKTEAFILPILQKILLSSPRWGELRQPRGETLALIIYPTKALARDQLKKIQRLCQGTGIRAEIFDGDTEPSKRKSILATPPEILITNPDMLHCHLQNPSSGFRDLLPKVLAIILDEIHVYTGAFGSNMYFILQRLQRLFGRIQLIGASATILNPDEFGAKLFDRPVSVVRCPSGRRGVLHFAMLQPTQRALSSTIVEVMNTLSANKLKTLVFANNHRTAETINLLAQQMGLYSAVHRAGLPKTYRETVERAFKDDRLDSVVATPTLELGIDIGDLNVVISVMIGFTRLTQRMGRAGRKGQESLALLMLKPDDPISAYYADHPTEYLSDEEFAFIEPDNETVAFSQLLASAFDRPLRQNDFPRLEPVLNQLVSEKLLESSSKGLYTPVYRRATQALKAFSIRSAGAPIRILHHRKEIGERSMPIAAEELHPGAIYLHAGQVYQATQFGFDGKTGAAQVVPMPKNLPYRTRALVGAYPELLKPIASQYVFGTEILYGRLRITKTVNSYLKKDLYSDEVVETIPLETPIVHTYNTLGFLFEAPSISKWIQEYMAERTQQPESTTPEALQIGAYHALEHVLIESSNMLTGGGSNEIGGVSMGTTGIIAVYDGTEGGSGVSKLLYNKFADALQRSYTILKQCSCNREDGCPRCTYSYHCGNNNKPLFRKGAIKAIELILANQKSTLSRQDFSAITSFV